MFYAASIEAKQTSINGKGNAVIVHLNGDQSSIALGRTENTRNIEAICMSGKTL